MAEHAAVTAAFRDWKEVGDPRRHRRPLLAGVPDAAGMCPCSSLSRLADEGTPTVCERDVYGAVTMLVLEALGSGTTYLVDTVDLDAERNVVRLWHCGRQPPHWRPTPPRPPSPCTATASSGWLATSRSGPVR